MRTGPQNATKTNTNKNQNLMKKTTTLLAALSLGVGSVMAGPAPVVTTGKTPAPAVMADPCAGPISYNNLELLYANTDLDYGDSADGFALRGEYSPMKNLYITASVGYDDWDLGNQWNLSLGIGAYMPLTDNIHLAADAGVLYSDWEMDYYIPSSQSGPGRWSSYSDSDTGWYVRPHLRAKFGCLTLHAGAQYSDINDSEDWAWFVNAYYQLNANWDLTAGYNDGDDAQIITAGVRYRY